MKKKYLKLSRIQHFPKKPKLLHKIFNLRFLLGFSRIKSKKSLHIGRYSFLHRKLLERDEAKNTRPPINEEIIWSLPNNYSFVIISDIHLKKDNSRHLERLQNAFIKGDAFLVATGDLTASGSKAELEKVVKIFQNFPVPSYLVIGNHDIYRHNWKTWQDLVGETIYRVDKNDTTLIMLDSANGFLGKTQLDWLEKQLETRKTHTFIFSHCNFFIPRKTTLQQFASIPERQRFISICKYKVDAVFTGHSHKKYSHVADGILFLNMEDFRDKGTFCRFHVSPTKNQYTYSNITNINIRKNTSPLH